MFSYQGKFLQTLERQSGRKDRDRERDREIKKKGPGERGAGHVVRSKCENKNYNYKTETTEPVRHNRDSWRAGAAGEHNVDKRVSWKEKKRARRGDRQALPNHSNARHTSDMERLQKPQQKASTEHHVCERVIQRGTSRRAASCIQFSS